MSGRRWFKPRKKKGNARGIHKILTTPTESRTLSVTTHSSADVTRVRAAPVSTSSATSSKKGKAKRTYARRSKKKGVVSERYARQLATRAVTKDAAAMAALPIELPPRRLRGCRKAELIDFFEKNDTWLCANKFGHWRANQKVDPMKDLGECVLRSLGLSGNACKPESHPCPVVGCVQKKTKTRPAGRWTGSSKTTLIKHLCSHSTGKRKGDIPRSWLESHNYHICRLCKRLVSTVLADNKCHRNCAQSLRNMTEDERRRLEQYGEQQRPAGAIGDEDDDGNEPNTEPIVHSVESDSDEVDVADGASIVNGRGQLRAEAVPFVSAVHCAAEPDSRARKVGVSGRRWPVVPTVDTVHSQAAHSISDEIDDIPEVGTDWFSACAAVDNLDDDHDDGDSNGVPSLAFGGDGAAQRVPSIEEVFPDWAMDADVPPFAGDRYNAGGVRGHGVADVSAEIVTESGDGQVADQSDFFYPSVASGAEATTDVVMGANEDCAGTVGLGVSATDPSGAHSDEEMEDDVIDDTDVGLYPVFGQWGLPSLQSIAMTRGALEKRVPRRLRLRTTQLFARLVRRVRQENTRDEWKRLFIFWKVIFWRPNVRHHRAVNMYAGRLLRWTTGDQAGLWYDYESHVRKREKKNAAKMRKLKKDNDKEKRERDLRKRNARKATELVKLGEVSKAMTALMSDGVADLSDPTLVAELRAKHPEEPPVGRRGVAQPFEPFPDDDVKAWGARLQRSSSGGLDQMSAQFYIDCAANDQTTSFVDEWRRLVNLIGMNGICAAAIPVVGGASLTALNKKGGGVRPVAAGCLLRRCLGAMLGRRHVKQIKGVVGDEQFGVDVPDGTLCAALAFEKFAKESMSRGGVALKADFANAFNMIKRRRLRAIISERAQFLLNYFDTFYAEHTLLVASCGVVIRSQTGTQQGDPMGSYLFALFLHDILDRTKVREIEGVERVAGYHDDVFFTGTAEGCAKALKKLDGVHVSHGSRLKQGKSHWFGPPPPPSVAALVKHHGELNTDVLGVPIGNTTWLAASYDEHVRAVAAGIAAIGYVSDLRVRCTLLRQTLSVCRVNHLLRARFNTGHAATWQVDFDTAVKRGYERIVGQPMPDWHWRYAQLTAKNGGGGVHTCQLRSSAAFIAAHRSCARLLGDMDFNVPEDQWLRAHELERAEAHFEEAAGQRARPDEEDNWKQSTLTTVVMRAEWKRLFARASPETQKDMVSMTKKGASTWMHSFPDFGVPLNNAEYRTMLKLRHCLPFAEITKCGPHGMCSATMDAHGRHALTCKHGPTRIGRHDALCNALAMEAKKLGSGVTREALGVGRSRPGDVAVSLTQTWMDHRFDRTFFDVGVVGAVYTQRKYGVAVDDYAKSKIAHYREDCEAMDIAFVPMVTDAHGWWSPEAYATLKKMIVGIAGTTEEKDDSLITHRMMRRLGTVLWKHNARMVLNHCTFVTG